MPKGCSGLFKNTMLSLSIVLTSLSTFMPFSALYMRVTHLDARPTLSSYYLPAPHRSRPDLNCLEEKWPWIISTIISFLFS